MTTSITMLEQEINNTTELSSICRGEWCRALESKVDELKEQVDTLNRSGLAGGQKRVARMAGTLRRAYRNLSPDIHA